METTPEALSGIRVLDLSESVAGQFCCRMLADYGADVLLVEPPSGSAIRRLPPLDPTTDSILFFHLNLGKRSQTIDMASVRGRDMLLSFASVHDVIVVGPDADRHALQMASPDAIVALVSDFGIDGPYRSWRGSEMVYQALSGMMYANGSRDRQPLFGVGQRASYAAGVGAYITILSALYERGRSGLGQQVSIDIAQNACAMAMPTALEYAYNKMLPERAEQRSPFGVVWCSGAWVCFWLYNHAWQGLCDALGLTELVADPRFASAESRLDHWPELVSKIQSTVRERDADEVLREFGKVKLVAARVYSPVELWSANPHLKHREFWEEVQSDQGARPILGPQFRMSATPRRVRSSAPKFGSREHQNAPTPRRDRSSERALTHADATSRRPLSGLRVLEFTTAWAGPMAGRILGFLGAEVIHVESAGKLDLWRQHTVVFNERRYPDGVGGDRPYNRNALFNSQNQNKLSLCIDVKHPKGLAALRSLAAKSDIVVCNFTAGTLERMGLGYETLKQLRPDIIVIDMPGFGATGPLAQAPANGFSMEMAAGMSAMIGYPGGPPLTTGPFYPDPIGGYHGAAAALTALLHRQASGEGQYVEVPQVEASMQFIGEELLQAIATGESPDRQGNRVGWAAPHDAYPAKGTDQWVAIAVETDNEWQILCRLMENESLLRDPRFLTAQGRNDYHELLREPISSWTGEHSKFEIADRLQAAGIRAAPILSPDEIIGSPYMLARNAFGSLKHQDAGIHLHQTLPFKFELTPGSQHRASPCLGADTEMILTEILKYSPEDIDELSREGVTLNIPAA